MSGDRLSVVTVSTPCASLRIGRPRPGRYPARLDVIGIITCTSLALAARSRRVTRPLAATSGECNPGPAGVPFWFGLGPEACGRALVINTEIKIPTADLKLMRSSHAFEAVLDALARRFSSKAQAP